MLQVTAGTQTSSISLFTCSDLDSSSQRYIHIISPGAESWPTKTTPFFLSPSLSLSISLSLSFTLETQCAKSKSIGRSLRRGIVSLTGGSQRVPTPYIVNRNKKRVISSSKILYPSYVSPGCVRLQSMEMFRIIRITMKLLLVLLSDYLHGVSSNL